MNWVAPITDEKTLNEFREELKKQDMKYYIMFEIGIGTGMQVKDILNLRVKDVRNRSKIKAQIGNTGFVQTFNVPLDLQELIRNYTENVEDQEYLITGRNGNPVQRGQAYRALKKAGTAIGMPSVGAQTMRKTWAWNYYQKTGDIHEVQRILNHSSPSMSYRFIGVRPDVDIKLKKESAGENERARKKLTEDGSGRKRADELSEFMKKISDSIDNLEHGDEWYGIVDSLLGKAEELKSEYEKETD